MLAVVEIMVDILGVEVDCCCCCCMGGGDWEMSWPDEDDEAVDEDEAEEHAGSMVDELGARVSISSLIIDMGLC